MTTHAAGTPPTPPPELLTPAEQVLHTRLDQLTARRQLVTHALEELTDQRARLDWEMQARQATLTDLDIETRSITAALDALSGDRRHRDALAAPLDPR